MRILLQILQIRRHQWPTTKSKWQTAFQREVYAVGFTSIARRSLGRIRHKSEIGPLLEFY